MAGKNGSETNPRRLTPERAEDLAEGEPETVEESLKERERKDKEKESRHA
jgi:hypothetical protein